MRINKGFSLIELLISTFISLLVLATIISSYTFGISISNNQLKQLSLKSELDSILFMIANDVKRAGYCGDCTSSNPFILTDLSSVKSNVLIDGSATKLSGSCVVFAYNEDSATGVINVRNDDARGFRLFDSDQDGIPEFEIYKNYSGLANWSCLGNHWQDMNNPMVTVTLLEFTRQQSISSKPGSTARMENLTITIHGTLGAYGAQRSTTVSMPNIAL
ncbi:prepilin-type N-terminal cleavage/methylation domain-containing protein [Photobacterium atrarenae]|uniref:Prepilin-type N-terminal cleavage/methylation domain-containing protein n=1 Tax=Photobacterium atrarenae TaxID=865757 RepID=A0ABY5GE44_9GAMM|nr:prepilin-type N-terminal cleavage/methylation domain-containing protein [Photobacterium atrarenae]UTV27198.1 prepilin-type N-terminal cleavage/methylation domain-containing protein [Photobacterium atrarenae]